MLKVISIFGTRPEAIKMAPVVKQLKQTPGIESLVWVTGQHREMLDQMLSFFDIQPDVDLDLMVPNQTLASLTANIISKLTPLLEAEKPDWVLVQGDTTSAMATTLAAFYCHIPVAHVEAGLRTHDIKTPWPEEANRQLIGRLATLHFVPTSHSRQNLLQEGVAAEKVIVTGNTVIDALMMVKHKLDTQDNLKESLNEQFSFLDSRKRLILVTGHRRENWATGLSAMCEALKVIAARGDVEVLYPVHLNPNVKQQAEDILSDCSGVHLVDPVDYVPFVYLMQRAYLIVTDSGGVQEEAPSLGVPVLVTRESTERPEGIQAGVAKTVALDEASITQEINQLLDDKAIYESMSQVANPYGNGQSAEAIVSCLIEGT